jgi:hypothetical protein
VRKRVLQHSEQHSGFDFDRLPVPPVGLKLPLDESVCDGLRLIGECTEEVNVLYVAFLVNDDPNRNGIKTMFR